MSGPAAPGTPPEGTTASHLPQGVPQQCAAENVATLTTCCVSPNWNFDRHQRIAAGSGPPVSRRQKPGHLRLPGHTLGEQTMVMELARCEYIEHRENVIAAQWHRQDPRGPGSGPGRLPKGNVRRLHHRRGPGPRAHGGQRRSPVSTCSGNSLLIIWASSPSPPPVRILFEVLRYERGSVLASTCPSTSGRRVRLRRLSRLSSPTTFTSWR